MGAGLIFQIVFMAQFLPPPAPSVLEAFNQFRANPSSFATILQERRKYFVGNLLKIPGEPDCAFRRAFPCRFGSRCGYRRDRNHQPYRHRRQQFHQANRAVRNVIRSR
jgi:hypothetical protein